MFWQDRWLLTYTVAIVGLMLLGVWLFGGLA